MSQLHSSFIIENVRSRAELPCQVPSLTFSLPEQPQAGPGPSVPFPCTDYEQVAQKAAKMEEEVKRLHQLIMDTNNQKLKAQQDRIDQIDKEIDECSSAITKGQVAARTAERYCTHCLCSLGLREEREGKLGSF